MHCTIQSTVQNSNLYLVNGCSEYSVQCTYMYLRTAMEDKYTTDLCTVLKAKSRVSIYVLHFNQREKYIYIAVLDVKSTVHVSLLYWKPRVQYLRVQVLIWKSIAIHFNVSYRNTGAQSVFIYCTRSQDCSPYQWTVPEAKSTIHFYELRYKPLYYMYSIYICSVLKAMNTVHIYLLYSKSKVRYMSMICTASQEYSTFLRTVPETRSTVQMRTVPEAKSTAIIRTVPETKSTVHVSELYSESQTATSAHISAPQQSPGQ